MRKAGGIIALVAGIFGVLAAIFTLLVGGLGAGLEAENASTVIGLGWGGVFFSFITIVLGAITLTAKGRTSGVLLMICAVAGAILGGTIVAVFMLLAFIGGLIAALSGTNKRTK